MADCDRYLEMISCLVDGELNQQEEAELLEHIKSCDNCKRVYEAFKSVSESIAEDLVEPPEMLAKGVMFKIKAHEQGGKRHLVFGKFTALAACFALLILGVSKLGIFDMGKSNENNVESEMYMKEATEESIPDESQNIVLNEDIQLKETDQKDEVAEEELPEVSGDSGESDKESDATGMGDGTLELLSLESIENSQNIEESPRALDSAEEISLYEGNYPVPLNGDQVKKPMVTIRDKNILGTLSGLLSKMKLDDSEIGNIPEIPKEEPKYSVYIPSNGANIENPVGSVISMWMIDGKLWCQVREVNEITEGNNDSSDIEGRVLYKAAAIPEEWDTFINYLRNYFGIEK